MAEGCMEVEQDAASPSSEPKSDSENIDELDDANFIIDHLITCEDVFYKSQQRGEDDLGAKEKRDIARKIFVKSKANFLCRFGKHLAEEHLDYFQKYTVDNVEGFEVIFYLNNLRRNVSKKNREVKNRRYDALNRLIEGSSYFSETEMMKRNPLLYDQLVGRYLSEDERKQRDNLDPKNMTFVGLLLESIDRDRVKEKQKQQQEDEDNAMEEAKSCSDEEMAETRSEGSWYEDEPITLQWGGFVDDCESKPTSTTQCNGLSKLGGKSHGRLGRDDVLLITATERRLLKEEFVSIMYQNFLDGKDADFDYTTVDNNEDYDNLNLKSHDAEDRYFDSESPENVTPEDTKMASENTDTSEDELDVFMRRLDQQQTIKQLAQDISNL